MATFLDRLGKEARIVNPQAIIYHLVKIWWKLAQQIQR